MNSLKLKMKDMLWCLKIRAKRYLRLGGVVLVVGVSVLAGDGGLDAGRVEQASEILLLTFSQTENDAT